MAIYLALTALVLLTTWIYYYFRQSAGLPPGPWGLPIIGYLPWLAGRHPHLKFTALAEKYGSIYSLRMGSVFTVVVSCPRLIKQAFALNDFSGRAPLYLTHGIMKGNGIICVQGEKWKETRKFVSATLRKLGMVKFGPGRTQMEQGIMKGVRDFMITLKEHGKVPIVEYVKGPIVEHEKDPLAEHRKEPLVDLRKEPLAELGKEHLAEQEKEPIAAHDPEPLLLHALGNVLFRLVFGVEWKEDDETWKTLQHLQEEGTKYIGVSAAINFLPFLRILPKYKASRKFIEDGIAYTHKIYQKLLTDYEVKNSGTEPPNHFMGAFVEEMRRQGEAGHFNREQFNFLMADIFGAGVDTTLATLRWFLLVMALHPQWQDRVLAELEEVTEGKELLLEHISRTTILESCVLETQRMRAVTPVGIPHGTIKETQLGGYRIPAGTMIIPLQWAIHMDASVYDQPHVFNPGRFIGEDGGLSRPEHFIPFQAGKRMCVGEEYARALLFLFGGNIIREFSLALPEGVVLDLSGEPGITLTPPSYRMIFTRRKFLQGLG